MLLLIETNHSLVILVVFSSGGLGVVRPRLAAFASKKCSETHKMRSVSVFIFVDSIIPLSHDLTQLFSHILASERQRAKELELSSSLR